MTEPKTMPIQVDGELALSHRRGEPVLLVRAIPWAMIADEQGERQCVKNHSGQTLDVLRSRGGIGACEAVRIICGISWIGGDQKVSLPEAQAHRVLYAMLALFNRGKNLEREGCAQLADAEQARHNAGSSGSSMAEDVWGAATAKDIAELIRDPRRG